jgi:hypothetical protein
MDCFVADMIYVLDFVRESNMDSHPYVEGEGGGRGERERERERAWEDDWSFMFVW